MLINNSKTDYVIVEIGEAITKNGEIISKDDFNKNFTKFRTINRIKK
jgi:hypothetical protein